MDVVTTWSLFLVSVLSCLFLISKWNSKSWRGKLPPGPMPLPIIGNMLQLKWGETAKSLMKLSEQFGPVYTMYFGSRRVVVLNGYDAVKEALVDQADDFSGRGAMPTVDNYFQNHGVILSSGERWKQLRRFTLMTLRNFGMGKRSIEDRIKEEAQFLVENLHSRKGKFFDPTEILNLAVSNVICAIVFHDRFDYDDKEFTSLVLAANEIFERMSCAWGQLQDFFPWIMNYVPGRHQKIVPLFNKRRAFIMEKVKRNQDSLDSSSPRDYIDCFLMQMEKEKHDPSSEFNMRNLVTSVENLFFAGTETVSGTLRTGFKILLKHPEITEKMHQEIDLVIGRNRAPVFEDKSKMPYTDAVIHEIQRFSDLLPMNVPHSVIRDTKFRGYIIPETSGWKRNLTNGWQSFCKKPIASWSSISDLADADEPYLSVNTTKTGTDVLPLLSAALGDSKKFKDTKTFNPQNFLDENGVFKKNDAFVPFSLGKRVCLGEGLARMELFLFLTNILQNFNLRTSVDSKDLDIIPRMTGFANQSSPYEISFVPR